MNIRFAGKKLTVDDADLALGPYPHVGPEYSYTGGDDAVHSVLFQVTTGVFPHHAYDQIGGEELSVVGVAGEIQVCPAAASSGKFVRLVIQDQDGFRLIQAFCQLAGASALLDPPVPAVPVRPAKI